MRPGNTSSAHPAHPMMPVSNTAATKAAFRCAATRVTSGEFDWGIIGEWCICGQLSGEKKWHPGVIVPMDPSIFRRSLNR